LCCAGRGKEQLFDAINALAIFEWNKNDRAAGGQFIFKIITQQTKHMSALNHWGMQRKAGVICVVFVLHVLWL
jgi:hypothetical protein